MERAPSARLAFRATETLVHVAPDGAPDPSRGPAAWSPDATEGVIDRFRLRPGEDGEVVVAAPDAPAPHGCAWVPFRSVVTALGHEAAWAPAARALSLADWRRSTRFCGRCGGTNADEAGETARRCTACGAVSYPRVSPAILAVVRRGDRILLAGNARFKGGIFSLLAGFVEPGESLEACLAREVREEVGIEVGPARFLGSQPWPFPDSLMVGFACDWVSGELVPDGVEIVEAGWYGPHDHPPLPLPGSLSRTLIDAAFAGIADAAARGDA
jgi:NAD+ diphosphatase